MSRRTGLPFGWWKSRDFWAGATSVVMLVATMIILLMAWFFDGKPWW